MKAHLVTITSLEQNTPYLTILALARKKSERSVLFLLLCTFCFQSLLSLLKAEEAPDLHVRNGVRAGS